MNTALVNTDHFKRNINNSRGKYELALESPEPEIEVYDQQRFIDAMANAVNGVQVVTTDGRAGQYGLTINTLTSVSAEPPMVLVCINRKSPVREAILNNGVFCANVLSIKQSRIAGNFSGHPKRGKPYDFSRDKWVDGLTGSPILSKALASFDCFVERSVDAGSHTIFISSVVSTVIRDGAPLLYTRRSYGFPYLMDL